MKEQATSGVLPHRDQDTVLRLYVHYFEPADLMFEQAEKTRNRSCKSQKNLEEKRREEFTYIRIWLSLLYVVCEEFDKNLQESLNSRPTDFWKFSPWCFQISDHVSELKSELRAFRNGQFHFQKSHEKQSHFFTLNHNRLLCAEQLHLGIRRFFSEYKVACEVHYLLNDRAPEGSFRRNSR